MTAPFTFEGKPDDIDTECWICGRNIHAGSWPPVCPPGEDNVCLKELEFEVLFNRLAKEQAK